jgi:P pilus assembly chaperone PapD
VDLNVVVNKSEVGKMSRDRKSFAIRSRIAALACAGLVSLVSLPAFSEGIALGAVRLIYSSDQKGINLSVINGASNPYLVMSRLSLTRKGKETVPFLLTPPLFRLEGKSKGLLHITANTQSLPLDRESLFYLTVVGIPPSNPLGKGSTDGYLGGGISVGYGNSIKMFYRPVGLAGTEETAVKGLVVTKVGPGVSIKNPSPYYISFLSLRINGHNVTFDADKPGMLAPFGEATYPLQRAYPLNQAGKVSWKVVTGLGATSVTGGATLH